MKLYIPANDLFTFTERFVYKVQFDDGEEQVLSFNGEFSDTFKEIEYQSYTLKYRFMNKYSSGKLIYFF